MAERFEIDAECFFYRKVEGVAGDLPFVIETAFAYAVHEERSRVILAGLNFSPVLKMPFPSLQWRLGDCRVDSFDPVVFIVHVACPRFKFIERGKGAAHIPAAMQSALDECVDALTKEWKTAKRRADRQNRVRKRDLEELRRRQRARELSIKEAAYQVIEQAYLKASAQGTLPANARQIMYSARPLVLELTGGKCWKKSSYFTQHLLPDYMEECPEKTARWYVVSDARGKLVEPHTQRRTDLGTIEVASYIKGWHKGYGPTKFSVSLEYETCGPDLRYRFALFVEKEGFNQLLQSADIANRFDLAIMSTKGMSVTAARILVEDLTEKGVTIGVLHDFDKAGFSIVHTLRNDTRRYRFKAKPSVIDLGLRLEDVQAMGLESEPVEYPDKKNPRINLRESGASEAECDFLVKHRTPGGWIGERVELNAMTSEQFLTWLVDKLKAAGVKKVIPAKDTLQGAYLRAVRLTKIQESIDRLNVEDSGTSIPPDLQERVRRAIEDSGISWDRAIGEIARRSGEYTGGPA